MKILGNQTYGRGETPVFLAFLDEADGTPIDKNNVTAITFSHSKNVMCFSGTTAVHPNEVLERLIALDWLLPAPVESPTIFEGTNTESFAYNFIFLPSNSAMGFYPSIGDYRTLFEFHRRDNDNIQLVFESKCVNKFSSHDLMQGEIPNFHLIFHSKRIIDTGAVQYDSSMVSRGVLTVLELLSGKIMSETEIPMSEMELSEECRFSYKPKRNLFPSAGQYMVRFVFIHADGSPDGVAEITIKVNAK